MIRKFTRKRHVVLAVSAAALLLALIASRMPESSLPQGEEDVLAIKRDQLSRYGEKLRSREDIEARLTSDRRLLQRLENGLLQAKTPSLAAVDIQQLLTQIAGTTKAEIKTMRIMGTESQTEAPYIAVPVQVTLLSDIGQLVELLHAIDGSEKLLRTQDLSIRSAGARRNHQVLTTMTVEGFMAREGG